MSAQSTSEPMVVSRTNDPRSFEVPSSTQIPEKIRLTTPQTYKSGGLNFYAPEAKGLNHHDRERYFMFSISMANALKLEKSVQGNFNFPPSEQYPEGLIQTA